MIEKDYYRLEDLKNRFNLTEADVLYLIEQHSVKACFYTENSNFVIGGWCKDGFVGYAHVPYQGIVVLPDTELVKLLRDRKVTPMHYLIPKAGSFSFLSTEYNLELDTPNDYIHAWKPKALESIHWDLIPARLQPYVTETLRHSFKKITELFFKPTENRVEVDDSLKKYLNYPKLKLTAFFKTFQFSDICVRHQDLVNIGLTSSTSALFKKTLTDSKIVQAKLENEFEDLLAAIILQSSKKLTAKKIHRILCDECGREEDSRLFDKNNILLSEDQGVITWRDKYRNNKQRSYMQTTLNTVLSDVRKKITG